MPYVGTFGHGMGRYFLGLNPLRGSGPHLQDGHRRMTQQWDSTVSNDDKQNEKSRAIRARQRAIGRELRRMYDDVAQESVPDDFLDLLKQIDQVAEAKKS